MKSHVCVVSRPPRVGQWGRDPELEKGSLKPEAPGLASLRGPAANMQVDTVPRPGLSSECMIF